MEKLDKLKELALPLYEWLLENYDPMCKIIISFGEVEVVREEAHGIMPIDD